VVVHGDHPGGALAFNAAYSVAVDEAGSGAAYEYLNGAPLPKTYASIRIDQSCLHLRLDRRPLHVDSRRQLHVRHGRHRVPPDPPTKVVISSPAQTVVAGGCSGPSTAQLQNANGPVPAAARRRSTSPRPRAR